MKETGKIGHAERVAVTEAWHRTHVPNSVVIDWAMCRCSEYRYPHPPHADELAIFEFHRSQHYDSLQRKNPHRQTRHGRNLLPKKARSRR